MHTADTTEQLPKTPRNLPPRITHLKLDLNPFICIGSKTLQNNTIETSPGLHGVKIDTARPSVGQKNQ